MYSVYVLRKNGTWFIRRYKNRPTNKGRAYLGKRSIYLKGLVTKIRVYKEV